MRIILGRPQTSRNLSPQPSKQAFSGSSQRTVASFWGLGSGGGQGVVGMAVVTSTLLVWALDMTGQDGGTCGNGGHFLL